MITQDRNVTASLMRIWHSPQIPMQPFMVSVGSLREAALILRVLAEYDLWEFRLGLKPDYSNAQGLEVQTETGEWEDWEDDDGYGIREWADNNLGRDTHKHSPLHLVDILDQYDAFQISHRVKRGKRGTNIRFLSELASQ